MNQINEAVTTVSETSIHNSVGELTDNKRLIISPADGHVALWKLKYSINSIEFLMRELAPLKNPHGIALTAGQTDALDGVVYSIHEEVNSVKHILSSSEEVEILKPIIQDINQAIDQFIFLLRVFELDGGELREFYGGDIFSILLNLKGIKNTLYKTNKQIEKFARYNFHANADLYKEGFSVIISIPDVIKKLEILIERFVGNEDGKVKVLQNRKKNTKKLRRLSESAWTLVSTVPADNEASQRLHRAHDDLFHVFECFRSEDIVIDINDLAVFSRILEDAKDNYGCALTVLLEQERNISGGAH